MKCVLLVAGFATRLYPLTLNTPKSLLEIGGKPILDHLLDKLGEIPTLTDIILVSNGKFFAQFVHWAVGYLGPLNLRVLNDGSMDNETRLGALGDLALAIRELSLEEDTLVMAGDNLFSFSLKEFVDFFYQRGSDCITTHIVEDEKKLQRTGVVVLNEDDKVLEFEEKPKKPKSSFAVPPIYLFQGSTLPLLSRYLQEGGNPDAPGNFIPWLLEKKTVFAFRFQGKRYDIGTPESLEEARREYRGIDISA